MILHSSYPSSPYFLALHVSISMWNKKLNTVILTYIGLFIVYIRGSNDDLANLNILRVANFSAVICFSFALLFDLYKWYLMFSLKLIPL